MTQVPSPKDIAWFFNLFDPKRLSIKDFELGEYLRSFLKSIGDRLAVDVIILRSRDEQDVLKPLAWHGVRKKGVEQPVVTMERKLVRHIVELGKEYLIEDPKNDPFFEQRKFASKQRLKQGYVFPLFQHKKGDKKLDGFIIYFTRNAVGFTTDDKARIEHVNKLIENTFFFADRVNEIYQEFVEIDDVYKFENIANALMKEAPKQFTTSAKHFRAAARQSLRVGSFEEAGECFFNASEEMREVAGDESTSFRIENYAESALAYAQRANENGSRKSYKQFKTLVDKKVNKTKKYAPKDEFFFNKLINALDVTGLDDFAGDVYVDKMNIRLESYKRQRAKLSAFMYWIWKITSDYGENAIKFLIATMVVILFFALAYFPNPWGSGFVELKHKAEFLFASWKFLPITGWEIKVLWHNFISSCSFSVTVFSTLGFGNITPGNFWAHLCVVIEVICGWAFLGIFVTLFGRKFLRKIY